MNVSVIIPSHNNANLLAKALASFTTQERHSLTWEIIVIDNNSSDESTARIQREFRDKLPLTLIQQPGLPHPFALCKARNVGLRLARGEWIVCMDADIIPNNSYLATLSTHLNNWGDTSVIASSERHFISTEGVEAEDIINEPSLLTRLPAATSPSNYGLSEDRRLPAMKLLPNLDHPWDYMHGCNVVYRRSDAQMIGGYYEAYDGRWGFEDIDFAFRMIARQGCVPCYAPGLHVYHQDLPEDQTQTNRYSKNSNPNWARICKTIPNYKDYKIARYRKLSDSIKV